MSHETIATPALYRSKLTLLETERAIKLLKDTFERELAERLNLMRVSAPLFVLPKTGLNDDLNGVERPVSFDIPSLDGAEGQIVHSLAKWKRQALHRYGIAPGAGLYTDMNAIRRDETLDRIHSLYVDQWDWEQVITERDRTREMLVAAAQAVLDAMRATELCLMEHFPVFGRKLPEKLFVITTQELEDRYPALSPKEREDAICREYAAVLLTEIGGVLKSGNPHDGRAPDYDDWGLNGDILLWEYPCGHALELSSMGIRVDAAAMHRQLALAGCEQRSVLPFHQGVLEGILPLTMGGGIGQSRLCMYLLEKAHIGEVQASCWPTSMWETCEKVGIHLL
ncbi:MAG: aspartate--ammonia ligase [Oscillospiraceae bacterium]